MKDKFLRRFVKCFEDLYGTEDILNFVVRGHLFCESALAALLSKAVKRVDALSIDRLDYQAKVSLCNALGLIPEHLVPGLGVLGKLRNRFVHRLDYEPSEEDQKDFINTIRSTCGTAEEYFLSRRTEFPNGLRRCILVLFMRLEFQLAASPDEAKEMLVSVAAVMMGVSGLDPEEFAARMQEELKSFKPKKEAQQ